MVQTVIKCTPKSNGLTSLGSNRVATRKVISIRNLVIERLLGLSHAVIYVISSA